MKCLVTGGAGFIGSHLCELLLKQNFDVIAIDNFYSGNQKNINNCLKSKNFNFFKADIRDEKQIEQLFEGIDYVFHLAGLADIVPSIENPEEYYTTNVTGTLNIANLSRKYNVKKIIYAASSSCYGLAESFPTSETDPIKPEYPYALTKFLGEEIIQHWGKVYNLPYISLRLFNVYGPRSRTSGTYGAVFGVFLAQKLKGKPFTVVGDGTQTRDFTFVSDVANAFYMSAISSVKNEVFNVGSGNHYSINKLVDLLKGPITYIPKRPGEPSCTYADTSKIQNLLKWKPAVLFDDGVKIMLDQIDYWKDAPLWEKESIQKATETWFKFLK